MRSRGKKQVLRLFFLPPLAIARVGGSDTPLESFVWDTGRTIGDANRTVVRPDVTFEVLKDGSLRPYRPSSIQFRDGGLLRPVAPFFELWATVQDGNDPTDMAVTLDLLKELRLSLDSVTYTVTAANRKAQRRTQSPTCAFVARLGVRGNDHERKPLLAFSPHNPGEEPLVFSDRPIPFGHVQVIRPSPTTAMGADLSVLRVRFTPAKGEVYGPPEATAGPASPLPPGGVLPTLDGRLHEIVPERNRTLNPNTPWSLYCMDQEGKQQDPQPSDSYDGANVGTFRSWGVVDDTCDGIIEAHVVIEGERFVATTRVFSCCPDYAPDRRPFFSFVDDLADRDFPSPTDADIKREIPDLFVRIFDTASMVNVDALRQHAIEENADGPRFKNPSHLPAIDERTMTAKDEPFVDRISADLETSRVPKNRLGRADVARRAHGPMCDVDELIDVLRTNRSFVQRLIRPPFGRFKDLAKVPTQEPNPAFRDPRVVRDAFHDMRMPPYMRDSDETPLSLTYRQYRMLLRYMDMLVSSAGQGTAGGVNAEPSPAVGRVTRVAERVSSKK